MTKLHKVLDTIMAEFNLKNDAALAKFLNISPPAVSKIRTGYNKLGGDGILNIYDKTGWSVERIRDLIKQEEERRE